MCSNTEESINLIHFIERDIFSHVLRYLTLKDLFVLRYVNSILKDYVEEEFRKLKQLVIPNAHESMRNAIPVLIENCRSLVEINLNKNTWIEEQSLTPLLINNHSTLETLKLNGCRNIQNSSCIQPVIISCKKLATLNISGWPLSIGSIEALAFHHENLTNLDLSHCDSINERCLIILASKFYNIQIFNISHISWINNNTIKATAVSLKRLRMINLSYCPLISDVGISLLISLCSKLESVSIRGCIGVTETSVNLLRNHKINVDRPNYLQRISYLFPQ